MFKKLISRLFFVSAFRSDLYTIINPAPNNHFKHNLVFNELLEVNGI